MKRRVKRSSKTAAKPNGNTKNYIVTARFPGGKTVPIRAVGAAGKAKAIALIKKHAPSAKYTVKQA